MTDFRTILANMRRPRLLIRAARFGQAEYRRDRDLRRIGAQMATPERVLPALMAEEDLLESRRKSGDAAYSVARHIDVLIALMAEVRLNCQRRPLA